MGSGPGLQRSTLAVGAYNSGGRCPALHHHTCQSLLSPARRRASTAVAARGGMPRPPSAGPVWSSRGPARPCGRTRRRAPGCAPGPSSPRPRCRGRRRRRRDKRLPSGWTKASYQSPPTAARSCAGKVASMQIEPGNVRQVGEQAALQHLGHVPLLAVQPAVVDGQASAAADLERGALLASPNAGPPGPLTRMTVAETRAAPGAVIGTIRCDAKPSRVGDLGSSASDMPRCDGGRRRRVAEAGWMVRGIAAMVGSWSETGGQQIGEAGHSRRAAGSRCTAETPGDPSGSTSATTHQSARAVRSSGRRLQRVADVHRRGQGLVSARPAGRADRVPTRRGGAPRRRCRRAMRRRSSEEQASASSARAPTRSAVQGRGSRSIAQSDPRIGRRGR